MHIDTLKTIAHCSHINHAICKSLMIKYMDLCKSVSEIIIQLSSVAVAAARALVLKLNTDLCSSNVHTQTHPLIVITKTCC